MVSETLDTSLLPSSKKAKPDGGAAPTPAASRKKRILKGLAYAAFFFASLVFFTVVKIPNSAIANYLLNYANRASTSYNFQAEKIAVRFFPLPHLEVANLAMEPRFPGAGVPVALEEVKLYPNPLVGLGASFRATGYRNSIRGAASPSSFKLEGESVDLAKLTPLADLGLDLKGLLSSLYVQLSMSGQRVSTADGEVRIVGKNIVFDPTNFGLPVPLPVLQLGDLELQGTATNGQVKIDKLKLGSPGKDIEIQVPSGTLTLSDVALNTRYDLHVIIKPSPAIEKAVPLLPSMLSAMATKRPDGFFGIKLAGTFAGVPSIKKE